MVGNSLELSEITGNSVLLEQVYALRVNAWRTQVALPADMLRWEDAVDGCARHWAFFHQVQVVAAVRLSLHDSLAEMPHPEVYEGLFATPLPGPLAYYGRVVVHPDFRRRGLFTRTHQICAEAARDMGATAMIGVTGSIDANRFTESVFLAEQYQPLGDGKPYRSTPYEATHAPRVFIRWLDRGTPKATSIAMAVSL